MRIDIIKRKVDIKEDRLLSMHERCERFAKRFVDSIVSMTLRLKDVNGPKGGVDKECIAQIKLNNGMLITTVKRHENIEAAAYLALDTARARLRRSVGQRKPR